MEVHHTVLKETRRVGLEPQAIELCAFEPRIQAMQEGRGGEDEGECKRERGARNRAKLTDFESEGSDE
eukprot:883371-Pleurochrysis_carterae.AAC.1